ncbi:MAG: hypothetical protein AB7I18_12240 [Candidatus Berkiella sp.]
MRYYGVLLGVSFHLFLALNGFQLYLAFSTIAIALHFLFLPDKTLLKLSLRKWHLKSSRLFVALRLLLFVFIFTLFFIMGYYIISANLAVAQIFYLFWGLTLLCFTAKSGYPDHPQRNSLTLRSPWLALNLVPVLFFVNCLSPYFGLKTGQAMAMFSNLTIEEGRSNHLLIRTPPYLFNYTKDYVTIIRSNDPFLNKLATYDLRLQKIYFDQLMQSRPKKSITFKYQGKTFKYTTIEEYLKKGHTHTLFEEKFLVCGEYDPRTPRACSLVDQINTQIYKPISEINYGYE